MLLALLLTWDIIVSVIRPQGEERGDPQPVAGGRNAEKGARVPIVAQHRVAGGVTDLQVVVRAEGQIQGGL